MQANGQRALGERIFAYVDSLATFSESPQQLTRRSLTREHAGAMQQVGTWMEGAGMASRTDAIGNIIGRYEADRPDRPTLLLGSHLDTVRNAGRFDGMLGVVTPIVCVEQLHRAGERLPFAVEVIGFADEEGVRFQSTLLGSRALAGTLDPDVLERRDADGVSVAEALAELGLNPQALVEARRAPQELLGFVEVHIEQGPVLEREGLPVGVVTAIAGASRFQVTVQGQAGHAGTVPMAMRHDALAAAAEAMVAIEGCCAGHDSVVATVGRIAAEPGAVNVIPGRVEFSLDVRAGEDALRAAVIARIDDSLAAIAHRRGVRICSERTHEAASCRCSDWLSERLSRAVSDCGFPVRRLASGAGHDAMAMAAVTDVAMLFVRCEGGISHHPDEAMTVEDAGTAAGVMLELLRGLGGARDGELR